jgi:hypothetical protein
MSDEVNLAVEGRQIVLSPAGKRPREGWREAAARMSAAVDDELLLPDVFEDDRKGWSRSTRFEQLTNGVSQNSLGKRDQPWSRQ